MNKFIIQLNVCFLFPISLVAQPVQEIIITNMKQVNTEAIEFAPVLYHSRLVYVSSEYRHGRKDTAINENTFELLYADLDAKGKKLSKPASLSMRINSKYHEDPSLFENLYLSTLY